LADSSFVVDRTRSGIMAGWRQAVALAMTGEEIEALTVIFAGRTLSRERLLICAIRIGELSNRASAEYKRLQAIRKWCGQSNEVSAPCRGAP
jgi:hypothetical protein